MNRRFALLVLGLSFASAVVAQPVIRSTTPYGPILNSASLMGPELTGSGAGIAQGSIFVIFGSGLGLAGAVSQATTFPLSNALGGTSVSVTVGGVKTNALMLDVYYGEEIVAALPSATPTGSGTFTVTYGGASASAPIQVVPSSFGIYSANMYGTGQALATDPSYNPNSIIHTFNPGDLVILWGTGLGAVTWDETQLPPPAQLVSLSEPVEVYVGNTTAVVGYHGRSGCCTGLDQVVFTVPAGVEGCYVPVSVKAGAVMSNFTTIAISSTGQTCSDSVIGQDLIAQLAAGQNVRFVWVQASGGFIGDNIFATFNEFTPAAASLASYGPSSGYCMTVEWGNPSGGYFLNDFTTPSLNAGPALTLTSPTGTYQIAELNYPGAYEASITTQVLEQGQYTISGAGGSNVGAFTTSDSMPALATDLVNIGQYSVVPRSSDLVVKWDPTRFSQPNGLALVGGYSIIDNADGSPSVYAWLQCTAPVAAGQFTIPTLALSMLPATPPAVNGSPVGYGYLWLGEYDSPTTFIATGLDKGIMTSGTFTVSAVYFQ